MTDFVPTLRFVSDPGHGWLAVPRRLVEQAGVERDVSSFSYQSADGKTVYLEEDCDASLFMDAAAKQGIAVKVVHASPSNSDSFVRRLPKFTLAA